jgi:site-specific DNA-methyltransferase (adenine-specific)
MTHKRTSKIVTEKDSWETPKWLFDLLHKEFLFNVDAAATVENRKTPYFYGPGWASSGDALTSDWKNERGEYFTCYLNPPYSAGNIDKFMAKALEESKKGAVVVCLVPCATDTKWWHNYVMKAQEIRFIRGRVRFVGYDEQGKQIKNSPTFSSCIVIFNPQWSRDAARFVDPFQFKPRIGKTIEQPRSAKV